ncbi:MAG: M15 family metallopeptidase [Parasporobacterium sp.]|nr:M15 family metallopeptidase [Parasporobacterium sp.]
MKKTAALFIAMIIVSVLVVSMNIVSQAEEKMDIDYLILVNKTHTLPEDWEENLETVHFTNSVGDDVEVEKKAYDAYLQLKDALEAEGVYVDLDSARRSVAAQQKIMDDFTEWYGADYAAKIVAKPGYSEHHTGLALDLYLIIDGEDIVENEDMIQYPEIWAKIHEKLADYGFILRYLDGKEHITGYAYEPWHIRFINDADTAREIMDEGITLEGYLGVVNETDVMIDYGTSALYTPEELEEAAIQIKCDFAFWDGCELHSLQYAGDESANEENVKWLNEIRDGAGYTQAVEFTGNYHSPVEAYGAWEPDMEYEDYQWWLARTEESGWEIVSTGY